MAKKIIATVERASDKTARVSIISTKKHKKYSKIIRFKKELLVHDEKNLAKSGDRVEVVESRPYSKTKAHRIVKILENK